MSELLTILAIAIFLLVVVAVTAWYDKGSRPR